LLFKQYLTVNVFPIDKIYILLTTWLLAGNKFIRSQFRDGGS